MTTQKIQGVVKWFNQTKGFGFIAPVDGGKDVFVHASAVKNSDLQSLQEKEMIEYEIQEDAKGKIMAVNLRSLGFTS